MITICQHISVFCLTGWHVIRKCGWCHGRVLIELVLCLSTHFSIFVFADFSSHVFVFSKKKNLNLLWTREHVAYLRDAKGSSNVRVALVQLFSLSQFLDLISDFSDPAQDSAPRVRSRIITVEERHPYWFTTWTVVSECFSSRGHRLWCLSSEFWVNVQSARNHFRKEHFPTH